MLHGGLDLQHSALPGLTGVYALGELPVVWLHVHNSSTPAVRRPFRLVHVFLIVWNGGLRFLGLTRVACPADTRREISRHLLPCAFPGRERNRTRILLRTYHIHITSEPKIGGWIDE